MTLALFMAALPAPDIYGLDCRFPEVRAGDARCFGHTYESAKALANLSLSQRSVMDIQVRSWNLPAAVGQWEIECAWRYRAWRLLEGALDPAPSGWVYGYGRVCAEESRRASLDDLRRHIGDEMYMAKEMPHPTCRYRYTVDD